MTLSGKDVVARSDDFETRAAAYELRAWQWAFLYDIDGIKEVRDVAYAGGVDMDLATDFIAESEAAGLVRVISMTLHEYRLANGLVEPQAMPADDSLSGYETAVPAWMIEHHEHRETPEPVAEYAPDPVAEYAPEPVAEYAPEPVAEYAEPAQEWQPQTYAAEPVAEHAEPTYEWQPDSYVAEPMAEQHEEAAVVHDAVAEWQPDTYVAEQRVAPVAFEIGGSQDLDAGQTVANLMSANGHAVSMSFGDEPEAAAPAWEPMSLVTTVDDAAPAMHEEPSYAFSDEASADVAYEAHERLEAHEAQPMHEVHAEPAGELPSSEEKGSIAFSFTPDMMTPLDAAPVERQRPAPLPEMPHAPMSPPPQQQLQMSGPPAQNGKGDLVGNLIARAFTFRIK